jgi:hypothetical protein
VDGAGTNASSSSPAASLTFPSVAPYEAASREPSSPFAADVAAFLVFFPRDDAGARDDPLALAPELEEVDERERDVDARRREGVLPLAPDAVRL